MTPTDSTSSDPREPDHPATESGGAASAEAPAPKRRTRKPAAAAAAEAVQASLELETPPTTTLPADPTPAAKPARRRTAKPASEASTAEAAHESGTPEAARSSEEAAPEAAEVAAPAAPRKRATRSAAAPAVVESSAPPAADVPAAPARQPAAPATGRGAESPPAAQPGSGVRAAVDVPVASALHVPPHAPAGLAVPTPVAAAAEAVIEHRSVVEAPVGGPEGESQDADAGEGGRRGRNRRRRGKDRERREGGEGEVQQAVRAPREPALPDAAESGDRFAEVLSGAYDAEPPEADDEVTLEQSTKRVLRPEPEAPKLHKVLAQSGIGSRRDMEQLILDGQVTVNDEVAHIGMRISYGDRVKVAGKPVKVRIQGAPARLLAYHKPTGEVVSLNAPEGRPTVFRRLPRLENGKWQSVGRLDINTEGLLLFSNSGELANQLMHPRFGVEREYAVRVLGSLDDEQRARLLEGVEIDGQQANFKSIEDGGGEGANRWYRVVITEGRNREVRKLFDKVGLAVSRLIRIRYGAVVLPRGLKRGVWVELGEQDVRAVRQSLGGPRAAAPAGARPQESRNDARNDGRNGRGKGPKQQPGRGGPQQARGPRPNDRGRPGGREERVYEVPEGENGPPDDFGPIPNPLEQTFDRRFAKGGPRRPGHQGFGHGRPEPEVGGPVGTIPNPLEQTFDKRFVKGSQRINAGFGRPDHTPGGGQGPGHKKGGGPKQPDPMQTSVGYIGADAYFNKAGGKRGKRGR